MICRSSLDSASPPEPSKCVWRRTWTSTIRPLKLVEAEVDGQGALRLRRAE